MEFDHFFSYRSTQDSSFKMIFLGHQPRCMFNRYFIFNMQKNANFSLTCKIFIFNACQRKPDFCHAISMKMITEHDL